MAPPLLTPLLLLALAPPPQEAPDCCRERLHGPALDEQAGDPERVLEVLELLEEDLELAPGDPEVLERASRAWEAAGDPDRALRYLLLARRAGPSAALSRRLQARLEALAPEGFAGLAWKEDLERALFDLAGTASRRRLYANAVELYRRSLDTRQRPAAEDRLEKLLGDAKILDRLLESDVDVPLRSGSRRSRAWIARENARHSTWEDPHVLKGNNYTVVTDLGYELAEQILLAMEQMNRFYREVYQHKQRGGNMARCRVEVFRSREEFDRFYPGRPPSVKGFYSSDNRVVTYDPRSEGGSLEDLWSTLFHEASHQFTRTITTGTIPGWLNEGTSSYFEGARILPSGRVEKNLIPERRLRSAVALFDRGAPTLREVLSWFRPGSYPGDYYPIGWALVYFMHNYEDEEGNRIYLEPYRRFQASYRTGGRHDPFERFLRFFVEGPGRPEVPDFEAFEALFQDWIRDLHRLEFGPPSAARELVERGFVQAGRGHWESALASFRRALRRLPQDPAALWGEARALTELERPDAAILILRRLREQALAGALDLAAENLPAATPEDFAEACMEAIRANDRAFARVLEEIEEEFSGRVVRAVRLAAGEGYTETSHSLLAEGRALLGDLPALGDLEEELGPAEPGLLRRWRRLCLCPDLGGWAEVPPQDQWRVRTPGLLEAETPGLSRLEADGDFPASLEFEATLQELESLPGAPVPVAGLLFGARGGESFFLYGRVGSGLVLLRLSLGPRGWQQENLRSFPLREPLETGVLGLVQEGDEVRFLLDGRETGRHRFAPGELGSGLGLAAQGVYVAWERVRVRS